MTAYVANYLKRKRIFEKREAELVHALREGASSERIAKAAERLREARINWFKAEFSRDHPNLPPRDFVPTGEAREWSERPVEEILAPYIRA